MEDEVVELKPKKSNKKEKAPKKKKRHLLAKILILIVFVLAAILLFVPSLVVKHVVPIVATELLDTDVTINNAYINVFTGKVNLSGFRVKNYEEYKDEYAFQLENFELDVRLTSLLSQKVIIDKIIITGMYASLKFRNYMKNNNLSDILAKVKSEEEEIAEEKAEEKDESIEEEQAEEKKMVIKKFIFEKSAFSLQGVKIPIIRMELDDVGDGRSLSEIGSVILESINSVIAKTASATTDIFNDSVKSLNKNTNKAIDSTTESVNGLIDSFKGAF